MSVAVAFATFALPVAAQNLAAIPVELAALAPKSAPPSGAGLRVRAHALDAPGVARLLGLPETTDTIELTLQQGAHADLHVASELLASTFVVDFQEPAVQRLLDQLRAAHPDQAIGGAEIVAFVSRSMRSTYATDADLASEVARALQGDCTEHALLTAALARALRIPARIVWGSALVFKEGRWHAYGHAWVQTREAGRWILRDSALAKATEPVYYLPVWVFEDEGPGYPLSIVKSMRRLPSRLEVLGLANMKP